ncbi:MAG: GWxTD domain-containing protein [Chlorobiota bacterium]
MIKYLTTFLFLTTICSYSQLDKSTYYSYGESLYSEVLHLPYTSDDSSRVMVLAKVATEAINFVKVSDGENFGKYSGIVSLQIKFQNSQGIIKERIKLTDTVFFDDYDNTQSKSIFLESFEEVVVPNDDYSISFEFEIKKNSTSNVQKHSINLTEIEGKYSPIFLNTPREDVYTNLDPFLLKNTISFDAKGCKVIIPTQSLGENNYTYKIIKKKEVENSPLNWDEKNEFDGICKKLTNIDFKIENNFSDIKFSLGRNSKYNALDFNIPVDKILPGQYELQLLKNNQIFKTYSFEIRWHNRPISLNNLDYAIELMKYIASEKEIEKLLDSDDLSKNFLDWWSDKDPTSFTPFNEAIQQYYSRVDYAFFSFKTISESDGALTDRGKVFILKAFPTKVEEAFENNETLIKWKYQNIKKEYVFELINAGNYRLVEINDL